MPFERPDLAELGTRIASDIATSLGIGPLPRRSVLGVLARVIAGSAHMQHGHLDWISEQAFPSTAVDEQLVKWARVWGLTRKPATPAAGLVDFLGAPGAYIPASTILQRADGVRYTLDAAVSLSLLGEGQGAVTAEEAGEDGDAVSGAELAFVTPIVGVVSPATAAAPGLAGGSETETDDQLQQRLLQRIQNLPMGGAARDFERWALEVSEVTRAWVLPELGGLGTVGVTFAIDGDPSGPIPGQAKVDEVAAYLAVRRPVTARVTVFAPTEVPIDIKLSINPDTTAVRNAILASLRDLIRRDAAPGRVLTVSRIREAISTSPGEADHTLSFPVHDLQLGQVELGTLGDVTFL